MTKYKLFRVKIEIQSLDVVICATDYADAHHRAVMQFTAMLENEGDYDVTLIEPLEEFPEGWDDECIPWGNAQFCTIKNLKDDPYL